MTSTNGRLHRAPRHQGTPAAMARYATLSDARNAIETLENHGVDGVDMVLAGWRAEAAERSQHQEGADGQFVRYITRTVLRGSVLGALIGMVVAGSIAGVVIAAWTVNSWGLALALSIGFGAGLGSLIGAFLDVEQHVGFSDAWSLTLQDIPDGSIWVLVFNESDKARDTLFRTNPVEVRAPQVAA